MSKEKIYLSVKMDELGVMRVCDQQGRIVAGVRAVTLRHARDEAATFTLEAFDHSGGEKAWAPSHARRGT
ncbi:hypothetical protein CEY09_30270 [Achromobacter marplatensis]|uniref:Uncharacterized protein n=1 Tax=Achromobacter marplatensis TaxID=470868 RepID=A0ABX9FWB4_9BURK|nr:hypothetical protein [Achromobacter marplatensis]OWT55575.1 hypothetical protein CEY09_30270 [Achromobacter marplatensis]RBP11264.1 hypothetical protein DFP87_12325 [Achromobacter marplatensis]CAB3712321.1 hypothetical protein LMG26219_05998 [Achromobacter marplatensis]